MPSFFAGIASAESCRIQFRKEMFEFATFVEASGFIDDANEPNATNVAAATQVTTCELGSVC